MSEVSEPSHHLKSPGSPSGGSTSGDPVVEHPPSCKSAASPESDHRGRQRDNKQQQQQQQQRQDINTDKLWQSKQRGVCAGELSPKCHKKPDDHHHHNNNNNNSSRSEHGNGDGDHQMDSDTGLLETRAGGKRKHRRRASRKKRHWKPYFKLSWEEKKALDERETARASRVREEMFAKGLPVAPYNTTQFLMDEHDREEPDLNTGGGGGGGGGGARRLSGVGVGLEDTGSEEDFVESAHHHSNNGNNNNSRSTNNNNNNDEEDDDDEEEEGSDGIGRPGNAGGEFLQRDFSETYEMYHVESLQNMTKQELVKEYLELEKCMSRLEEENNRLRRAMEPPESSLARLRELEKELERLKAQNSELLLQNQPAAN
ncbi:protein HEXIM1 [Eucyclogobius newberryi]|uniref:protein HEXIM1 n=1 Tax=Eucyclogobius newberryi TaxID=166745 RepID=UPI003B58C34B